MKKSARNGETPQSLKKQIRELKEENQRLRAKQPEEYLQKSFEKANDLIVIIQDGKIKYANPILEKFLGYPFDMLKDRDFKEFLGENSAKELLDKYESRMSGKEVPEKYHSVIPHKDGHQIYVEISGHIITYKGKPADIAIIHDISPLKKIIKQLEESEQKYHNFFKASVDCVFFTTPDGQWLDMSDSAPALFGFDSKEDLASIPIPQLYEKPEEREHDKQRIEKEGISKNVPLSLRKKDGSIMHTLVTSQAIYNDSGNVVAYQGIIRDITSEKKNETLLQQSRKHLEETLATRDKFFSIIGHDLRTPFNAIIGLSDYLRKEANRLHHEELESIAADLYLTGRDTYELLTNLLEWSRRVTGKMPVKPEIFELSKVIQAVKSLMHENIQRKHLNLTIDNKEEGAVFADRNMVHTIFRNLLSNAIKFTHPYGSITIECLKGPKFITVNISDTGVGINRKCLSGLFNRETTITSGTSGECGSGLGLLLCREFVEHNKGTISAKSTPGKGSTFTFTLPRPAR